MTVPFVLVLGLLLGHLDGKSNTPSAGSARTALSPVSVAAPPANPAADTPCTRVMGALPITLSGLAGRPARSSWTYVAAWGDPAIVLRCGVARPTDLTSGSSAQTVGIGAGVATVFWLPVATHQLTVWTSIDRAVYVEVSVPTSYAQPPLAAISDAVAKALPAVCVVDPNETDVSKLCTHRH